MGSDYTDSVLYSSSLSAHTQQQPKEQLSALMSHTSNCCLLSSIPAKVHPAS